uniref:Uncharacterized protein n=1 Tax=Branchiostoma floridae TaxID=7739 RepID=C3YR65_BRAFL|eukprot:XP_002601050.1 hypothetical protein BRAFLDRAFT_102388 [Branchiostoma floridae]
MRQDSYESALDTAYQELFQFIRNDLFSNPRVLRMTDLSSRLVESIKSLGIEQIKDSTKKHMWRSLESEFCSTLHFFSDDNRRLFVYPDNLSRCDLVKAHQALQKELNTLKSLLNKDVVAKAALLLRDDIRKQDVSQAWPPVITEEDQSRDIIPPSVVKFFCYLLTGGFNNADASQRVERLVTSFGYDIVYAMFTVYEILRQSLIIKDKLQLKKIVCVFDQAIYAKATEVIWKHKDIFKPIVIGMGSFHTCCTLLAIIGKRFQGAGLRDLAIESGVVAEGSVSGVMDGRRYNRAVRFHKLVYEALLRLVWSGFLSWMRQNHNEDLTDLEEATETTDTTPMMYHNKLY